MITLRPHQNYVIGEIFKTDVQNQLVVLPTGAGKTLVKAELARIARMKGEICVALAHRDVLLGQISDAMCLMNLEHTFIASKSTITNITNLQVRKFGRSFYNPTSTIIVGSVDTVIRRDMSSIAPHVKWWFLDESHHLTCGSKWHRCIEQFKNARGVGVTATPIRADNKGLGVNADGVFHRMIVGATMGELIQSGALSPYKIFVPPDRIDVSGLGKTASGDYNQRELAKRTDKSDITGDAVEHYLRLARDKQAICFTVNIEHGEHVAAEFRRAGVSAVNLSSKDSDSVRHDQLEKFKRGETKVLVNCDLFGEGFDVPAVECVIMLRKTESYSLFKQQFGRGLRTLDGKLYGILIDHVGNVARHCVYGLPHDDPEWSLERPEKKPRKTNTDDKPARICPECFAYYMPKSASKYVCPECEHLETKDETLDATKKFQAENGSLVEMNIEFISNLINERSKVDEPVTRLRQRMQHAPQIVRNSAVLRHEKRQNAQTILRRSIQDWCANTFKSGLHDVESVQRDFELTFGINILKAQILGEREALELETRIKQC